MASGWRRKVASGGHWDERDAAAALKAWRASRRSLAGFCRQHGLHAQRLAWWRDRLAARSTGPRLAPVTVTSALISSVDDIVAARLVLGAATIEVLDTTRVSPEWVASVATLLRSSGAR